MEAVTERTVVLVESEQAPVVSSAIPERLQQREAERREEAERRRREREALTVQEERSDYFTAAFVRERETIERLLGPPEPGQGPEEEAAAVSEAAGLLQELQRLLTDAVRFLAPYEVRQAQATLSRLQDALSERRQQLQPKKRFAFKKGLRKESATTQQAPKPPEEEDSGDQRPRGEAAASASSSPAVPAVCGFSQLEGQEVTLGAAELLQQNVVLSELTRCRVRLHGNPNTLMMRGCRDCTVLCGPVSTSVMVDDCRGCLLALACQQLRTHRTTQSSFYVQVTSRAILEDCRDVGFAPYTWRYEGIDADFETSRLDRSRDNWNQVDDFNWLARDQPSPNWSVILEKERVTDWE